MATGGPLCYRSQGDRVRSSGLGKVSLRAGYRRASYFAEDMRAVMDEAGIERAAVVCQSMGGWTGMQFALAYPERVSCLVLSCSPAGVQTPAAIRAMEPPPPGQAGSTQSQIPWNEPHMGLAADAFDRIPDRAFLFRQISSLNPPFSDVGLCQLRVAKEDMVGFATPTLVIAGKRDRIFGLNVMTEVSQAIPKASFTSSPMPGIRLTFETPGEFNSVVGDFIGRHG